MNTLHVAAMAVVAVVLSAPMAVAGNTSSNSSSNTSSNSSNGRSTIVHTHRWSMDSDDGRRRRVIRGTTHIERYRPAVRYRWPRRGRDDD